MSVLPLAIAAVGSLCIVAASPVALIVGMAILGFSAGPIDIGLFALRQRKTDPRWFGRIVAVSMSLNFAGVPIGSAIAGPILEHSIPLALVLAASIALLGCVVPFVTIPQAR